MKFWDIVAKALALALLAGYFTPSMAAIINVSAIDRGYWDDSGAANNAPFIDDRYDYHVGYTDSGGKQNNYVVFDLSAYSGMEVISATVSYYQNSHGKYWFGADDLTLYDVSTDHVSLATDGNYAGTQSVATFNDLQSGQMLGSTLVYNTYPNSQWIDVNLNSAGISDVSAHLGSTYAVGGTCNSCSPYTNDGTGNDFLLGFSAVDGQAILTLDIQEVSAVPVPAAVWLFGSGLIGLAGFARRKKA